MIRHGVFCLFVELVKVTLNHKIELSYAPSEEEWGMLFILAKKHALLGVLYVGIERLPSNQRPPRLLLLQWGLIAEHNKECNLKCDQYTSLVSQKIYQDGFRNVILKGQGIAKYYKVDNLECYRTPGDVDVWLDGRRSDIISYVRRYIPNCTVVYHHVDFIKISNVSTEIHFTPSWMNNYFVNRRLQRYFNFYKESLFSGAISKTKEIPVPSLAFNRVYVLVPIYRHLFHEGIGLRQLMDYYFVLRQGFTEDEKNETMSILASLKMSRFTSAVMWILQEIFGLEDCYLLTPSNEKEGVFLLNEVMRSGNLGQYDQHLHGNKNNALSFGFRKLKRNFRFVQSYPSEVLWSPLFKIWHYFWRKTQ